MVNIKNEKIKILIVEDDVFIAESLMLTLQELGYATSAPCITIQEAEETLSSQTFDLVLLDIQFFGEDKGIDFGKVISEHYNIPFIFLTAFSDAPTIAKASTARPSAYLVKPVSTPTLFATIQTALHNFHHQISAADVASSATKQTTFFTKMNNKIFRVKWENIISIEATKNYALIKSADNTLPHFPIRGSMQQALQLMPPKIAMLFVQVNRSCYLNILFITQVDIDSVQTTLGEYQLGESYRKQLSTKLSLI